MKNNKRRDVNEVILIGRVGNKPKVFNEGLSNQVVHLSLATNDYFQHKTTGEVVNTTQWHNCVLFSKLGAIANQYISKGDQIFVRGRIEYVTIKESDNYKHFTNIRVLEMKMLGNKTKTTEDIDESSIEESVES
jgi:single-strand DNA-binding protein